MISNSLEKLVARGSVRTKEILGNKSSLRELRDVARLVLRCRKNSAGDHIFVVEGVAVEVEVVVDSREKEFVIRAVLWQNMGQKDLFLKRTEGVCRRGVVDRQNRESCACCLHIQL